MSPASSDARVFFGATGDIAHKKIVTVEAFAVEGGGRLYDPAEADRIIEGLWHIPERALQGSRAGAW